MVESKDVWGVLLIGRHGPSRIVSRFHAGAIILPLLCFQVVFGTHERYRFPANFVVAA